MQGKLDTRGVDDQLRGGTVRGHLLACGLSIQLWSLSATLPLILFFVLQAVQFQSSTGKLRILPYHMAKNSVWGLQKEKLCNSMLSVNAVSFCCFCFVFSVCFKFNNFYVPTKKKKKNSFVTHYGLVNSQTVQKYFKVLLGHSQILNIVLHFIVVT